MLLVGIDPSFSKTGVCILNTKDKKIKFIAISPPGKNDSYKDTLNRSAYVTLMLLKHIATNDNVVIIVEEPLINSMKASSLSILSGVLVTALVTMPFVTNVYSAPTSYVSRLNREVIKSQDITRKKASELIADGIISFFINTKGYSIEIESLKFNKDGSKRSRKLSHDEAEALLLTIPLLKLYNIIGNEDIAILSNISKKIGMYQKISLIKGGGASL